MTQLSSTASTCAAQWKMWLFKVFGVICLTAVCAAQDPKDVTTVLHPAYTTSRLPTLAPTTYVPPVPVLQNISAWLDVFPSEEVELNCSISGISDWTFTWYRNNQLLDPGSDPNWSFSGDGSVLTFTAGSNSGRYYCIGLHNTKSVVTRSSKPLNVTVYANKPKPKMTRSPSFDKMFPGESVTFRCMVDVSSGWEYLWYHNGHEIPASNTSTYEIASVDHSNSGQYHCKARRGKGPFYTEASETTSLQVSDPPTPTLKLLTPWPDVFENELVGFSCEVNSPDWTFTWYKNQQKLQEDSWGIEVDEEGTVLNITEVTKTHEGLYACKAHHTSRSVSSGFSNTSAVTVYESIPKPTLSKDPAFNPMYMGETVNFTCKVTVSSGWVYQWYKDERELADTSETISIYLGPSDGGKYSCKASRGEATSTSKSEKIQQDVTEIPVPSVKAVTQWLDVFPTESVTLSCGIQSGSGWTYTWYKDTEKLQADNTVSFDSDGATLSISSSSAKHEGQYACKGHLVDRAVSSNFSSQLNLTVYGCSGVSVVPLWSRSSYLTETKPKPVVTQQPILDTLYTGESVSFECKVGISSGWSYYWFKDADADPFIENSSSCPIDDGSSWDNGIYECEAVRGKTMFKTERSDGRTLLISEIPVPSLKAVTQWLDVFPTESVTLSCGIQSGSGWTYTWYKDTEKLQADDTVSFDVSGATLSISSSSAKHEGQYECKGHLVDRAVSSNSSSQLTLTVYDKKPTVILTQDPGYKVMFREESVAFSCHINISSGWEYLWYKDGSQDQGASGNKYSFILTGTTNTGSYTCRAKRGTNHVFTTDFSQGIHLKVKGTDPTVTLTQNPNHNLMHTGDPVSFSCHINISSGWDYLWNKDGKALSVSGNNHSIISAMTSDSGSYQCHAKRGKTTISYQSQAVRIDIHERPQANVILLTGWSDVFSTDSLVLKCEVMESQDQWNYTWSKEGQPINLPPSERHTVTPQNDPDQSLYTCQGNRVGRPSYSKWSDSFKTKNLLLKRRVLLSISGCLFFGIIAVLLGCIVLRVIRKPADDDDKPEEDNLFLTMAQLKDCTDAPCPLVDYITDAALNELSKEVDENGAISSETTPLPITSQEDQAVTVDGQDAEESNGLVSFQQ